MITNDIYPFAKAEPFRDGMRWLGGEIRIIPGGTAANADYLVTHTMRRVPRAFLLLDVGTNAITGPLPRGSTAWDRAQVSFNLPNVAASQPLIGLLI